MAMETRVAAVTVKEALPVTEFSVALIEVTPVPMLVA
jgi:hypothetical protein